MFWIFKWDFSHVYMCAQVSSSFSTWYKQTVDAALNAADHMICRYWAHRKRQTSIYYSMTHLICRIIPIVFPYKGGKTKLTKRINRKTQERTLSYVFVSCTIWNIAYIIYLEIICRGYVIKWEFFHMWKKCKATKEKNKYILQKRRRSFSR